MFLLVCNCQLSIRCRTFLSFNGHPVTQSCKVERMEENKKEINQEPTEKKDDIETTDTGLRYMAYTSDVGEAFRPVVPAGYIRFVGMWKQELTSFEAWSQLLMQFHGCMLQQMLASKGTKIIRRINRRKKLPRLFIPLCLNCTS